ncbi:MAG: hypothetical protein WCJ11_00195 [Methylococcaceae bacterium]
MGDAARARVSSVQPNEVDALLADGALALDIRDKEEHDADCEKTKINANV